MWMTSVMRLTKPDLFLRCDDDEDDDENEKSTDNGRPDRKRGPMAPTQRKKKKTKTPALVFAPAPALGSSVVLYNNTCACVCLPKTMVINHTVRIRHTLT